MIVPVNLEPSHASCVECNHLNVIQHVDNRRVCSGKEKSQKTKRPHNAFYFYAREHWRTVERGFSTTNGAFINKVLGQRWRALPSLDQFPFYQMSRAEEPAETDLYCIRHAEMMVDALASTRHEATRPPR
ncbi:lymphoid enhancer-binding factor 1-like [Thalassophryne amazonica]|uniref:lymphoid enhancer-binding factor 1-like n=1 Tax=Thalassophryne amazonica TaxID=390379 RepID=UPI001472455B|nr:lymphoid enhancer-binding factor 1-like [Thalassophryne amazonica]XP_034023318.1 lymphoid enhancer-binding factor 1-like [Thalassophryne amazonica]